MTLRLLALPFLVSLAGCGAVNGAVVPRFRPDPPAGVALVEGRDCSFDFAGLTWRDLSVREAARHALAGTGSGELGDMSYYLVESAPFEMCLVVEGTPLPAASGAADTGGVEHDVVEERLVGGGVRAVVAEAELQ